MSQRRKDWELGRRLYEDEGKTFVEISEVLDCKPHTVSAHAQKEGWINRQRLVSASAPQRAENILRAFIERDSEAIRRSLESKHEINEILLRATKKHAERLEAEIGLMIKAGTDKNGDPFYVDEDPLLALRRCALVVQSVEAVDRSLANLKDASWRKSGDDDDGESAAEKLSAAQLAALLRNSTPPSTIEELN